MVIIAGSGGGVGEVGVGGVVVGFGVGRLVGVCVVGLEVIVGLCVVGLAVIATFVVGLFV